MGIQLKWKLLDTYLPCVRWTTKAHTAKFALLSIGLSVVAVINIDGHIILSLFLSLLCLKAHTHLRILLKLIYGQKNVHKVL